MKNKKLNGEVPVVSGLMCWTACNIIVSSNSSRAITLTFKLILLGKV